MVDLRNQKIQFLNGPQSKIETLQSNGGATEGAFYLTNDTHRLYIGAYTSDQYTSLTVAQANSRFSQGKAVYGSKDGSATKLLESQTAAIEEGYLDSAGTSAINNAKFYRLKDSPKCTPLPINAGIEQVETLNELPSNPNLENGTATFYYVNSGNILCIYGRTGGTNENPTYGWIQINSDTFINNLSYDVRADQYVKTTDTVVVSGKTYYTYNDTTKVYSSVSSPTNANISTYYEKPSVGIIELIPNNTNDNAQNVQIKLIADENIFLKQNDSGIFIEAKDTVGALKGVAASGSTKAKLRLINSVNTSTGAKTTNNSDIILANGSLMEPITGTASTLTFNAKSQKVHFSEGLPKVENNIITGFEIEATQDCYTGDDDIDNIIIPAIKYGSTGQESAIPGGTMNVYTTTEIDSRIAQAMANGLGAAEAMHYKGTISKEFKASDSSRATFNAPDNGTLIKILKNTPTSAANSMTQVDPSTESVDPNTHYYILNNGVYELVDITEFAAGVTYYKKVKEQIGATYKIASDIIFTKPVNSTNYPRLNIALLSTFVNTYDSDDITTEDKGLKAGDLIVLNSGYKWDIIPAGNEDYDISVGSDKNNSFNINLTKNSLIAGNIAINHPENGVQITSTANSITFKHRDVCGPSATDFYNYYLNGESVLPDTAKITDTNHDIGLVLGSSSSAEVLLDKSYSSVNTVETNKNLGWTDNIYYVTKLMLDKQGHIIRSGFKKGTIPHNYLSSYSFTQKVGTTDTLELAFYDAMKGDTSPRITPTIQFSSTTLNVGIGPEIVNNTPTNNAVVTLDLVWGSF